MYSILMLTNAQKQKLAQIKKGELDNPQKKADFYYRVSKNMRATLKHSLKEIVELLDEMPEESLEKIDFYEASVNAIALLEKLINRLEPARAYGDGDERRVIRNFRVKVNNPLPGVALTDDGTPIITYVTVTYRPQDSEVELAKELEELKDHIKGSMDFAANDFRNYTTEEFNKIKNRLEKKQSFEVRVRGIAADKPK